MQLQFLPSAGGNATFNGYFIPTPDLLAGGIEDESEFDVSESIPVKRDKAVFAILMVALTYIKSLDPLDRLGLSVVVPDLNNATNTFAMTVQRTFSDSVDSRPLPVPVPETGIYLGRGAINFTDIYPSAIKATATQVIAVSGVLINASDLELFGTSVFPDTVLGEDSRHLLFALMKSFASDTVNLPTRSATTISAISERNAGTSSEVTIPTAYYTGSNPTSGILLADVPNTHLLSSGTVSISFVTGKTINEDGTQTWGLLTTLT